MKTIKYEKVRSGQLGSHKDSVTEIKIITDETNPNYIKRFCTEFLLPCKNEANKPGCSFTGTCSFPYGLESFYSFRDVGMEDNMHVYTYKVCYPYTG